METPANPATQRLASLNALLDTALGLPPGEREAWLAALAPEHRALEQPLRAMLARAQAPTDAFMRAPVSLSGLPVDAVIAGPDRPGDLVGPYRLLRELGAGGMAHVWLAERADGAMQRQVALKLPHAAWAFGLAERMARERDILASLEHPLIARLYDAGVAEGGRPYLAMEYVDGRPIDRHCREEGLGVEAKLRLFLQVCQAVSHAHARLVVHRDLKPSNILVTKAGEVRLLDFGVAKLLEGEAQAASPETQLHGRALTPDYASPEQLRAQTLGAGSDVYSLGVVLYELLAGTRPYRLRRESPAALEEAVLAGEVAPASSRVREDRALARALAGDLDTILAKAMRPAARERYASVDAFASDLQRHLRGEPVLARPDGFAYRAGKFARRHAWPLAGALAIVLSLGAGLAAALLQAREADRQRLLAVEGMQQAEATLEFVNGVITEGIQAGETLTRDDLLQRGAALAEGGPGASSLDRLVAAETVSSWNMSVGRHRDAEALLRRTLAASRPADAPRLHRIMTCRHGSALASLGRVEDGIALLMGVIDEPGLADSVAAYCLQRRALVARYAGDAATALRFALQARDRFAASGRLSPTATALLEGEIGYAYSLSGQPAEADRHFAEAIRVFEQAGRAASLQALTVFNNWGIALLSMGAPREALAQLERALAIAERYAVGGDVPGFLLSNIGQTYLLLARLDEARASYERLLPLARRAGDANFEVAAFAGLAEADLVRGRLDEAQAHLDAGERLASERKLLPGVAPVRRLKTVQVALWIERGHLAHARGLVEEVLAEFERSRLVVGALTISLRQRSVIHAREGRLEAALADAERSLAVARETQGAKAHSSYAGAAHLALSRLHARAGREDQARQAAAQAREHLVAALGEAHPLARQALAASR